MGRKQLTWEQIERIKELRRQDHTMNAIAEITGHSMWTIVKYLPADEFPRISGSKRTGKEAVSRAEDIKKAREAAGLLPYKPFVSTMPQLKAYAIKQDKTGISYASLVAAGAKARLPKRKVEELDTKGCEGCVYWRWLRLSIGEPSLYACHYCLDKLHSRGCPSGSKCTVKVLKK